MPYPIIDLHCDLLCYLQKDSKRTLFDPIVRCSLPQLRQGNVKLQVLAVFAETGQQSVERGMAQAKIYQKLPLLYPEDFFNSQEKGNWSLNSNSIGILLALEGASTFCSENEPIQQGLDRLNAIIVDIAKPVYIGFTWNMENRFGGGALTEIGLKEDGKRLLEFMHQKQIAVDLSHASDALAYDLLNYIDQKQLNIPVMASHSNARVVANVPRNLPNELAQEVIKRRGLIGLNLYKLFVGPKSEECLVKHLSHWIENGGLNHVCFGADFFYKDDLPISSLGRQEEELFFPDYGDASCYGRLLSLFRKELKLTEVGVEGLAYGNALSFLQNTQSMPSEGV